ncbi:MAG TPA: sulfite exporter TauE/SafE family protein [Gemmatimonadales bacterium]|nr:sulfite exporter TauE/SafE family protein [Gemmatimonadales bacterium]
MQLVGFALAVLIGLSLGMLGGGGSTLTVPIFVYVLGFAPKDAIAMSLPVVGLTSLIGAFSHWRNGNLQIRTALLFGAVAMLGSYVAARYLAPLMSGALQLALLAIVMLAAAISMFRSAGRRVSAGSAEERPVVLPLLGFVALGVGAMTGLVGVGGGFLIVPALVILGRVPMKEAIGTSLLVIAMNTTSGYLGYAGRTTMEWGFLAGFTVLAIVGILFGSWLVRFVSQAQLKRAFAVFLICVGAFVLFQNRDALLFTTDVPAPADAAAPR